MNHQKIPQGASQVNYSNSFEHLNEKINNKKQKTLNEFSHNNNNNNNVHGSSSSSADTSTTSTTNLGIPNSGRRVKTNSTVNSNNRLLNLDEVRFNSSDNNNKYSNEYNSKQINPNIDTIDIEENNFNTNPHLQLPTDNRSVNLTPLDSQHLTDAQAQLNIINKNNLLSNSKQTNKQAHTSCKKTSEGKLAATSVSKSVGGKMARSKKTKGRVKIKMEFIENKIRRYTTFSKRKTGIMKKAYELSTLTGTQVMLLVASETGHVYTFATDKLQPMITSEVGKNLIQSCLSYPQDEEAGCSNFENNGKISIENFNENDLEFDDDFGSNNFDDESDDQ